MSNFHQFITFLDAWIKNPRAIGALVPSSIYLAKYMTNQIQRHENGMVLELGPGTGAITTAMLNANIPAKNIISLEKNAELVDKLKIQYPDITVVLADATQLVALFQNANTRIDTVVSSLPILLLDKADRDSILTQIPKILSPQGRFIQFTYNLRKNTEFYPKNYKLIKSTLIWRNLPPARVLVFEVMK